MKRFLVLLIVLFTFDGFSQECEDLSLEEETIFTENIVLAQGFAIENDSVLLKTIKHWKGDSIPDTLKIAQEDILSKYYRLDTATTYLLFFFHGIPIDRCSRTTDYTFVHFEYNLDILFKGGKVVDVPTYDTLKYQKEHIFTAEDSVTYDESKGKYAFYDYESGEIQTFQNLPKPTSSFFKLRYYVVDKDISIGEETYEILFCVYKSKDPLEIDTKIKKEALAALFNH